MHIQRRVAVVAAIGCVAFLSGCATLDGKKAAYLGNQPNLSAPDVGAFVKERQDVLAHLQSLAPIEQLSGGGENWKPVVEAGMLYVDVRCARFMDALFWINRFRDTTSHQIQYVSAATSAVLALTQATKELLGIAPLGFGLMDQTVNNVGQGLLYNLDPGTVSGLVARQQATYRGAIKDVTYTNRAAAMTAIQQYAALCLPVSIEGEVNRAIANSEFKPAPIRPQLTVDDIPPAAGDDDFFEEDVSSSPPPANNYIPSIEQRRPQ
jgi:hypothetical protein